MMHGGGISSILNPGRLRFQIALEQNTAVRDEGGAYAENWTEVAAAVRADITTLGGREFSRAQQVDSELTHEITIRYRSGVVPAMRVRYDDSRAGVTRYWDIRSVVNPDQRPIRLILMCRGINEP